MAYARRTRAYRCKNRCTTPRGLFAGHRNLLTTNLGVGGSNPSGRANKAMTLVVFLLLQLSSAHGISAEEPPRNHHLSVDLPQSGTISGVAAVYQRYQFLAERKEALENWAAHVAQVILAASAERRHLRRMA